MALQDEILNRVVNEVWANPHLDRAITIRPAQLTTRMGARNQLKLSYDTIHLPNNNRVYFVYQIGQLDPRYFGVDSNYRNWTKVSDIVNNEDILINFHSGGRQLMLSTAFMLRQQNNNTLIAVDYEHNRSILDRNESFYLRFYSNKWFATGGTGVESTYVEGRYIESNNDITDTLTSLGVYAAKGFGTVKLYHNGLYKESITPSEVEFGDSLEFQFDGAGQTFFDVSLLESNHFESALDGTRKYLLSHPDDTGRSGYEYLDDVEFYMCSPGEDGAGVERAQGLFYPRINESDHRMVTHRDWSINSNHVASYYRDNQEDVNYSRGFIRVFLRNAERKSPLPQDGNYVIDLYLLPEDIRKRVMVGTMSALEKWSAIHLEQSAYMRWLSVDEYHARLPALPRVLSWYGLNTIAEQPRRNDAGTHYTNPPIVRDGGMALEYDADGTMQIYTSITPDEGRAALYPLSPNMTHLQMLPGQPVSVGSGLDEECPLTGYKLHPEYSNVLFYRRLGDEYYTKAVEGVDYTVDDLDLVTWDGVHNASERTVRDARRFYNLIRTVSADEMTKPIDIFSGDYPRVNQLLGRLDVYLNGRKLIKGLDYVFEYPTLYLCNRQYYTTDDSQLIVINRGNDPDVPDDTIGFVRHRLLNYDAMWDISVNRNKSIFIEGRYAPPDEVAFSERRTQMMATRFREGAPYVIENPINNVNERTVTQLVESLDAARENDKAIEDFLTIHLPEEPLGPLSIIPYQHHIISFTFAAIIDDAIAGRIVIDRAEWSDIALDIALNQWRDELDRDVGLADWDKDYIRLAPHGRINTVAVTPNIYSFLVQVNKRKFNDKIVLADYLTIL